MKEWITGRNPVYETLRADRREVFRLWVAEGIQSSGRTHDILKLAKQKKVPVQQVPREKLQEMYPNNQGFALQVSEFPYSYLNEIMDRAVQLSQKPFVLLLDLIQDPQNLGTLIRSAEGFGVHGILIPTSRAAEVTPAVVNASSGASEHLLIAQMNLAQAIDALKDKDIWIYGMEYSEDATPIRETDFRGGVGLVVGSEGTGLRQLIRKKCDQLIKIPRFGKVDSLNASVAGSIALYEIHSQRDVRS